MFAVTIVDKIVIAIPMTVTSVLEVVQPCYGMPYTS
jgi:hypothetical protein